MNSLFSLNKASVFSSTFSCSISISFELGGGFIKIALTQNQILLQTIIHAPAFFLQVVRPSVATYGRRIFSILFFVHFFGCKDKHYFHPLQTFSKKSAEWKAYIINTVFLYTPLWRIFSIYFISPF